MRATQRAQNSKIGYELVVVHRDSYLAPQSGWTARDIFTASNHTACSIAHMKYFL